MNTEEFKHPSDEDFEKMNSERFILPGTYHFPQVELEWQQCSYEPVSENSGNCTIRGKIVIQNNWQSWKKKELHWFWKPNSLRGIIQRLLRYIDASDKRIREWK